MYMHVDVPNTDDVEAWQQSVDRAKINFTVAEHRRLNLELDKQYGPSVWKDHIKQNHNMQEAMAANNQKVLNEIKEINRKRKFS